MIFQEVVPTALVQDLLHSLHFDHTSAHLGVTKILEKVRSGFYWPDYKRDVEVSVASGFVCQKCNNPTKKRIHSLRSWKPSLPFWTVGIDLLGAFRLQLEIELSFWLVIISASGMNRSRYEISQLKQHLKPQWIGGLPALATPRAFTSTKDVVLKQNLSQV